MRGLICLTDGTLARRKAFPAHWTEDVPWISSHGLFGHQFFLFLHDTPLFVWWQELEIRQLSTTRYAQGVFYCFMEQLSP
jgi:hypothetical protein